MDRVTEGFLRCALARGHTIHVALEQRKAGFAEGARSLFDDLAAEFPRFSYDRLPLRQEPWLYPATRLRFAIDYLRYLEPEFAEADQLRRRARYRAPWYVRMFAALQLLRIKAVRRMLGSVLRGVERRMPLSQMCLATMREWKPDVVVISPLVELGSGQGDHLRAADALGIPTGLVVASWDNLTTKGRIRDRPDVTIVWNDDQIREASELHGLPAESVVAAGAHSHDHWFAWEPSTAKDEFTGKVGLDGKRQFVLYVCSSGFIAGGDEVEFVQEWSARLAQSDDPGIASLGVLVRPHPQNFDSWRDADVEETGRIVVWPRGGVAPTDAQSKKDYYDSLYHAKAVVGLNTTALVDSAIVRRPVFTLVVDRFRDTQTGTLHFSYLARTEAGGLLNVAHSWDEHFEQLAGALREDNGSRERIDGFLRSFVRPQGLDRPAAPIAIDAIERAAATPKEPRAPGGAVSWLVGATASGLGRLHNGLAALRPSAVRKRSQRRRKDKIKRQKERKRAQKKSQKGLERTKAAKAPKAAEAKTKAKAEPPSR
jgi:hypothetical protein